LTQRAQGFLFLSLLRYFISQGGPGDFSISFRYNRYDYFFQLGTSGIFYDSTRCVRCAYRCARCENLFLPGNSDVFLNHCNANAAIPVASAEGAFFSCGDRCVFFFTRQKKKPYQKGHKSFCAFLLAGIEQIL
jgi:hypothetical protein